MCTQFDRAHHRSAQRDGIAGKRPRDLRERQATGCTFSMLKTNAKSAVGHCKGNHTSKVISRVQHNRSSAVAVKGRFAMFIRGVYAYMVFTRTAFFGLLTRL